MLTIKIPIWISSAYVTMRITSRPGSANRLPYLAAPAPIRAQRAALCQFLSVLSCKPGGQAHPSPASAAWLRFAPAGGRETKDGGGKPAGGKISENRRLTRNGKTDILRPLSNRTRPEGGAQDDQRKHGLVRIGRKEAWTEGALRTHAALRSKTAFFARSLSFCRTGSAFFAPFRRSLLFCKEDIVSWNRKPSSRPGKRPR